MADSVRVDKWLWAARFFKTRSLATTACDGGKVDLNDHAAKPAKPVRVGDTLRVTTPVARRVIRVLGLAEQRGSPAVARALYDDLMPPELLRVPQGRTGVRPAGAGRPTKRERRDFDRLRGW